MRWIPKIPLFLPSNLEGLDHVGSLRFVPPLSIVFTRADGCDDCHFFDAVFTSDLFGAFDELAAQAEVLGGGGKGFPDFDLKAVGVDFSDDGTTAGLGEFRAEVVFI